MQLLAFAFPVFAQDFSAPYNGSVDINAGATYTNSSTVTTALSAEDDTAVTEMCLSNTTTCTSWKTYATSYSWNIGTTQGTRTVYAKFRDAAGNVSSQVSDTIVYDSVAPTGGAVAAATGTVSGQVDLSWSGFTEATSGIASYSVVYNTGSSPASKCTTGTTAYAGAATSASLTGLSDGTTYYVRVCATDNAGNTSTGATATVVPKAETNAPTGTVVINSDATYTTTSSVTLSLSATDDTGVTSMCISNTSTCTSYQTYTTSKTWTMAGNGDKTVYVYFKDASANVSVVATDNIIVDTVKPSNPTLTATPSDQTVDLSWTAATDATSGVSYYKVVRHTSAVSSCSVGTLIYTGTDTSLSDTGLSNGTKYYYRVCAVDNAGLVGTGTTTSVTPASEFDPPANGMVSINSGAAWTNATSVTLTLSAEDASGVSKMCISNTSTCTTYQTFAATKTWTLSGSGTTRTVNAWFQDSNGNKTATAVSDTIQIDTVKPTNGAVAATPGAISADLSWSGFADTTSGIASYKVVYAKSATAPTSCTTGTTGYAGTGTSATISGLSQGSTYSFRVCAIDAAGNTSTGVTTTTTTVTDTTPPTGTISLDSGAAWTGASTVTVTPTASDTQSGIGQWCVSTTNDVAACTWMTWTSGSATSAVGTGTVYAWFKDGVGNASATTFDSIGLDYTAPTDGALSATAGDGTASLSWTEAADTESGLAGYHLSYNLDGSEPVDCTSADVTEATTATTFAVTGLAALPYTFRLCASDNVGNVSAGATITVTPCTPLTWYADTDGDSYGGSTTTTACTQPGGYVANSDDCDDGNSAIQPGATETCDGVDNDCDGAIDDADSGITGQSTWYLDSDSDTYGGSTSTTACIQPVGYVATSTDCNDGNTSINPGAAEVCDSANTDENCNGVADDSSATGQSTWYRDADSDTYGSATVTTTSCDIPSGYVSNSDDCNDGNSAIQPGATETCDGVDNDCDGAIDDADSGITGQSTWYADVDEDGYGVAEDWMDACEQPVGYTDIDGDCDDADDTINPLATDAPFNGVDDDCDGTSSYVVQIAGGGYHTLFLSSDGTVWSTGDNFFGQLGDGTTTQRTTPVAVSGLTGVSAIDAGFYHSLAVLNDGTVWAWGRNNYGQLGDGTTTSRTTPVTVSGLTGVSAIAAGGYHSLAVKSDGTARAWGYNTFGQLGDGTTTQRTTPVSVSGLTGVSAIAAGFYHSLAVKSDGTVWAWGFNNYGQLGDGTITQRTTPVSVSGLTGVSAIAAGETHSLALKSDGTAKAWGRNVYGQLGDGTTTSRTTPVTVSGLTGVSAIAAGDYHSLAVKSDGTVRAWGWNVYGQLGDGTTTQRTTPVSVSGLTGVSAIAAGVYHSLAVLSDGTAKAWGYNFFAQLGDGTTTQRTTPVAITAP